MKFRLFGCLLLVLGTTLVVFGQSSTTIVVAQDGSGNYKTVQEAFDAIPSGNQKPITIQIRNGIYYERLILDTRKDFITLVGEDKDKTILTYNHHAGQRLANGDTINTWNSASFFIYANDFTAKNITFQNDAGFTAGQAVAVFANGDRLKFTDCRFIGFQDVLFLSGPGSRQYFRDCYIEGTTDFIFGPSTAVFQRCLIHSKKKSHVTAASTPREVKYGFVFFDCTLTGEPSLQGVSLGRPWTPYASVTYIRCNLGAHISAAGWDNWRNPANEKTARYAEFGSTGPGAHETERASWVRKLSTQEVERYTFKNIFLDWNPEK